MRNDINIQTVVGTSAGALYGLCYAAGRIGWPSRFNIRHCADSHYAGLKAVRKNGGVIGFDIVFEEFKTEDHENILRVMNPRRRMVAVATNCLTGEWEAFEKGKCSDIFLAARASATLPYLAPMVEIDGTPYLDGGCACKIPYQWALDNGFEKIIVIRTRETSFRKKNREDPLAEKVYRKYPKIMEKIKRMNLEANREFEEVERLHEEGRLLRIAPSREVRVSRLERDMEKLGELYWLGYSDAMERLGEVRAYLGVDGPEATA
jgi:predicted patatin/cPLA2 family phospholipase